MAGSLNAFANNASAQARQSSVLTEQDHNARAPKRVRLTEHAVASINTQCALPDVSLEVDHMVLDYLAYSTIKACFASRGLDSTDSPAHALSSNLSMFNAFLSIFKARHPTFQLDPALRLRVLLLKLTTLFTQRLTSNPTTPPQATLLDLRASNKTRAQTWIDRSATRPSAAFDTTTLHTNLPIPRQELERNRAAALHELGIPAEDEDYEDAFYATSACVALLDILSVFVELSAARNALSGSNLTQRWMELACEFMLQACLEQYLVFGAQGSEVVDEAFAWGYLDVDVDGDDDNDAMDVDGAAGVTADGQSEVNAMFEDEDYATEVDGWSSLKEEYIRQLFPSSQASPAITSSSDINTSSEFIAHLEAVAATHPIATFEASLLKFLEAISKSIPEPLLVQLENGRLDGMTELETQEFLAGCGVGVANFFHPPVGFKGAVD